MVLYGYIYDCRTDNLVAESEHIPVVKINISNKFSCFVDIDIFHLIREMKLSVEGRTRDGHRTRCVVITTPHKRQYLHRYIMMPLDTEWVCHIDNDKMNNCRSNLKVCSKSEVLLDRCSSNPLGKGISVIVNGNCEYYRGRVRINGKDYCKLFRIKDNTDDLLVLDNAQKWVKAVRGGRDPDAETYHKLDDTD